MNFLNKMSWDMTNEELLEAKSYWCKSIESSSGWSSSYAAAKCLKHICNELNKRDLNGENPYPIRSGC